MLIFFLDNIQFSFKVYRVNTTTPTKEIVVVAVKSETTSTVAEKKNMKKFISQTITQNFLSLI